MFSPIPLSFPLHFPLLSPSHSQTKRLFMSAIQILANVFQIRAAVETLDKELVLLCLTGDEGKHWRWCSHGVGVRIFPFSSLTEVCCWRWCTVVIVIVFAVVVIVFVVGEFLVIFVVFIIIVFIVFIIVIVISLIIFFSPLLYLLLDSYHHDWPNAEITSSTGPRVVLMRIWSKYH